MLVNHKRVLTNRINQHIIETYQQDGVKNANEVRDHYGEATEMVANIDQ